MAHVFLKLNVPPSCWISDSGIGPKFLGHITNGKDGRVVGFVVEWMQGARAAEPRDIDSCRKALCKLHAMDIKPGDINKHNFLVWDGHDLVLVDFEMAERACSPAELNDEISALVDSLRNVQI